MVLGMGYLLIDTALGVGFLCFRMVNSPPLPHLGYPGLDIDRRISSIWRVEGRLKFWRRRLAAELFGVILNS